MNRTVIKGLAKERELQFSIIIIEKFKETKYLTIRKLQYSHGMKDYVVTEKHVL